LTFVSQHNCFQRSTTIATFDNIARWTLFKAWRDRSRLWGLMAQRAFFWGRQNYTRLCLRIRSQEPVNFSRKP